MKTKCLPFAQRGFTLIEIMVVVAIIGLLAVIAVTNLMLARDTSRLNVIKRNLVDIDTAKDQYALEQSKAEGDSVADVSEIGDY